MSERVGLFGLLAASATQFPDKVAVEEVLAGEICYRELAELAGRLHRWLASVGVGRGDRVGIYLPKSIDSVAAIFGILRCGAAYVPLDPLAPATRNAYILKNCDVKALVVARDFVDTLRPELAQLGHSPPILVVDEVGGGAGLRDALAREPQHSIPAPAAVEPNGLAYVLYTSGSTGLPKGVMISHENAQCFVDWCSDVFQPTAVDRFSSHAPFHFDLSILDIYVPIKHGASVVLFGEKIGKEPLRLAQAIADKRISNWYSAPSILTMLVQQGRLDDYDWSALRMVLFAGEVFPVKHLRSLKTFWPVPRYFNLYGPTETNVCTWHEIPREVQPDRTDAFPIGRVCGHYRERVVDTDGRLVTGTTEGELCIAGPGVMQGYWGLPDQNDRVFLYDPDGTRWYRTGDIVAREPDGVYGFVGRRDRMIKKRGYRVELGEIEAALYRHAAVREAAVTASSNDDGVRVSAFLSTKDGEKLSIIALKQFCADQLPLYMVPDTIRFLPDLPKTSTDKINYQALKDLA
ncbi:MAG: amino acid adenylation domain-containing protein [Pirellulales bacterium]